MERPPGEVINLVLQRLHTTGMPTELLHGVEDRTAQDDAVLLKVTLLPGQLAQERAASVDT